MFQSRWHIRSKKAIRHAELSSAITTFRCLASWGAHGIEFGIGVSWQQSCPIFLFLKNSLFIKNKVSSEAVPFQRELVCLLMSLQAFLLFIAPVSQITTLWMLQCSQTTQLSAIVLNGAVTQGTEMLTICTFCIHTWMLCTAQANHHHMFSLPGLAL